MGSRKKSKDGFIWTSYSDLSTGMMMGFILILMYALHEFTKKDAENKEIKEKISHVDSSRDSVKLINTEFKKLAEALNKENYDCRDVNFVVPKENSTVIRVEFKGDEAWFRDNDSKLRPEAQRCLKSFAPRFLKIAYDLDQRKLKKKISQITVEGHTNSKKRAGKDWPDSYLGNLDLSQQRALETVKFIVQHLSESDHSVKFKGWREKVLAANGRSYAERILKSDGREDFEASKRVEFKASLNYGF